MTVVTERKLVYHILSFNENELKRYERVLKIFDKFQQEKVDKLLTVVSFICII